MIIIIKNFKSGIKKRLQLNAENLNRHHYNRRFKNESKSDINKRRMFSYVISLFCHFSQLYFAFKYFNP